MSGGAGEKAAPRAAPLVLERILARARAAGEAAVAFAEDRPIAGAALAEAVEGFAAALIARGVAPGDRAVIALGNGEEFLVGFLGAQRASAVPVPLAPESGAARLAAFARRCGARLVVVGEREHEATSAALAAAEGSKGAAPGGGERAGAPPAHGPALAAASVAERAPAGSLPRIASSDLGLIQYTSGSTGEPKGVAITHGQLLLNVAQLVAGFAIRPDDVFVTWLPMHHDMGLVLMTLAPLLVGARLHVHPTGLASIRGWAAALARHGATFTAAPDFAYRLALRLRRAAEPAPDLAALRVALDAAEPVRAATVRDFTSTFGLRPGAMIPGYGLAEATVGVTAPPPGSPLAVDARGAVGLGRGFPGVALRIAGEGGASLAPGEIGEVWVRSPALAAGYFDDAAATADTFGADGWLRTGDLGYLDAAGALFVVGRRKDLLSWGGSTIAPREVEELVDALPFVRRSCAVGIEPAGRTQGELPFLFVEVRGEREASPAERARRVVAAVREHLGAGPARVVLLRPGSIPLTANGKLRRAELAARWRDGALAREGRVLD